MIAGLSTTFYDIFNEKCFFGGVSWDYWARNLGVGIRRLFVTATFGVFYMVFMVQATGM
jgi:hypothetical protein